MAYQSVHTGPEVDAAASLLDEIQEIRDESNANKDTVVAKAAQVAIDANRTEAAAVAVDGVVAAAESARDSAQEAEIAASQHAADADSARALAVVARNGAEAAEAGIAQHAADAQAAATTAGQHAGNAADSEAAAATSASTATSAKTAAESARDAAQASATSASTDAGRAEAAAGSVDGVVAQAESARDDAAGSASAAAMSAGSAEQSAIEAAALAAGAVFDDDTTRSDKGWSSQKISGLFDAINALIASDDTNLDELQEIVDYIKLNRAELEALNIASIAGLQAALDSKQPLSSVLTETTASFTTALLAKLNGIATGAQVNAVNSVAGKTGNVALSKSDVGLSNVDNVSAASLRDRSTHTGTQPLSTIEGLEEALGQASGFDESPTPPADPSPGHRWLDTTTGIEYTWFEDADSGQWVEMGPGGSGPEGEPGPPGEFVGVPTLIVTQAQYDALTPDPNTLYVVTG